MLLSPVTPTPLSMWKNLQANLAERPSRACKSGDMSPDCTSPLMVPLQVRSKVVVVLAD